MRTEFPFRTTARLWREAAGAVAHMGALTRSGYAEFCFLHISPQ